MKGWKGWLLLTGFFSLFFLAWHLPADLCWRWWAARSGPAAARLHVTGIEGAWSAGRLARLQIGTLQLTDLAWTFRPLGLLSGRLEFALSVGRQDTASASTILALSPRRLRLRDLRGQVPAASAGEALLPGLGLAGNLQGQDLDLTLEQGRPVAASGRLSWQNAGASFPNPVTLGTLDLQLATEAGLIGATLKDQGGPLQINVLARLKPDGNYELTGELQPRGQPAPELASLLGLFGPPAADGRIRLQQTGQLAPFY